MPPATFNNPYNFIPAPPRTGLPDGLGDAAPVGHHRWHDDRWSGEIDVTMTVVTPLLVTRTCPDDCPHRTSDPVEGHRELEIATTADGRVDLAPTQVKGMLRASFEALTCSRFGVFSAYDRLGFRSESDGAAELLPALVDDAGTVTVLGALDGARAVAKVELWTGHRRKREYPNIAHGDVVEAVVRHEPFGWKAVSLHRPGTAPTNGYADGYVLVAGRLHAPGPTVDNKRHDAVFVTEVLSDGAEQAPHRTLDADTSKPLVEDLATIVEQQRAAHQYAGRNEITARNGKPWDYLGDAPGKTAWSRHLYEKGDGAPDWLGPDTVVPPPTGTTLTCWAETPNVDRVRRGGKPDPKQTGVLRLRPVQISRLLHDHPPSALLHSSLAPAATLEELSPADRVFGWTRDSARTGERSGAAAHRGQLRIVGLQAPGAESIEDIGAVTLPPLSSPKPSQGRFYLGSSQRNGARSEMPATVSRYEFFDPASQHLRGRKVYPHRRSLEKKDTKALIGSFTYRPPVVDGKARPLRDSQNATLHQWVRPGATFTFTVQVTDLHQLELGALLWLLDPQRSGQQLIPAEPGAPGRPAAPARHRLGMGRPLGFGAVELRVSETRLTKGDAVRERLQFLMPAVDRSDMPDLAAEFERAMPAWADDVTAAVRWSLAGYSANSRVGYPRNGPTSPIYSWFSENERKAGPKQSLPLPGSERRLHEN